MVFAKRTSFATAPTTTGNDVLDGAMMNDLLPCAADVDCFEVDGGVVCSG